MVFDRLWSSFHTIFTFIRERPDHFSSAKSTKSEQKCLRSNFWKPSAYLGAGKYARSEENGWAKASEPEVIGPFPDVPDGGRFQQQLS
jgi:hypothetical protein